MVVWLVHARVGHRQGLYPETPSPATVGVFLCLRFLRRFRRTCEWFARSFNGPDRMRDRRASDATADRCQGSRPADVGTVTPVGAPLGRDRHAPGCHYRPPSLTARRRAPAL